MVEPFYSAALRRWDWRRSAWWRLGSLSSVWVLVFLGSLAGPLLPLIGVLRMVFGGAQLALNQALARRSPLAGRDRWDWVLLALAFAGSVTAASLSKATGTTSPLFFLPLLLPYTALQLRSFQRSIEAHRISEPAPIPFPAARPAAERRAA